MKLRIPFRLAPRVTAFVSLTIIAALLPALASLVNERLSPAIAAEPLTFQIDINTADAAQLALLPGVGPALAARIIDDRSHRGAFENVAELRRVKGIGNAVSQGVAPYVRTGLTTQ